MWRIFLVMIGMALAGGCWWWEHPKHPAPVNASLYETDMIEAVVREVLSELPPPVPPVCFLAFGDGRTPPSADFIARFAGAQPLVRSCDSAASPPTGQYFDLSTGQAGFLFHVISFKEYVPGTFDVLVSLSNLPPGHDHLSRRISNLNGEWKVEKPGGGPVAP